MLSLWAPRTRDTYLAATLCTCFVAVRHGDDARARSRCGCSTTNRALAIGVIWITAIMCLWRKHQQEADARVLAQAERALVESREVLGALASRGKGRRRASPGRSAPRARHPRHERRSVGIRSRDGHVLARAALARDAGLSARTTARHPTSNRCAPWSIPTTCRASRPRSSAASRPPASTTRSSACA